MTRTTPMMSGSHRTMLYHEGLHAFIVLFVCTCATALTLFKPSAISSDLLSFVFGGALQYAGLRASAVRQSLGRDSDTGVTGNAPFPPDA